MKAQCPNCKTNFNVNEANTGKQAKCFKCGKSFIIVPFIETPVTLETPVAVDMPTKRPAPIEPHTTKYKPTITTNGSISKKHDELKDFKGFLSFRSMITPVLVKISYVLGAAFITIAGIVILATGEKEVTKIEGLIFILAGNLSWRITCEIVILLFSIHEILSSIEKELKHRPNKEEVR